MAYSTTECVHQFAAKTNMAQWGSLTRIAAMTGWTVDGDSIFITWFNPLTDSNVVASVYCVEEDGVHNIYTELRDHEGAGDMILHNPILEYHIDAEDGTRVWEKTFILHEMLIAFLDYNATQKQKWADVTGVEA